MVKEKSVKSLAIIFHCVLAVTQTMKELVKRATRPTAKDTRRGRVPYELKKAPPFTIEQMLQMRAYCLNTIEVITI